MSNRGMDAEASQERVGVMFAVLNVTGFYWANKILTLGIPLLLALIAFIATFLIEPKYRSDSTFLPASDFANGGNYGGGSAITRAAQQLAMGLDFDVRDPSSIFPFLARSRRVADLVLNKHFRTSSGDTVRLIDFLVQDDLSAEMRFSEAYDKYTSDVVRVSFDPRSGITRLSITLSDRVLAADVANAVVGAIDHFSQQTRSKRAAEHVAFISKRLEEVSDNLALSEDRLKQFLENNRAIAGSPNLRLEEARLQRSIRLNEQLFITLKEQLELARIEQAKNIPAITVIDAAQPSMERYSPKRLQIAIASFVLGTLLVFVLIYAFRQKASYETAEGVNRN